jgi:hypothetical protein
MPVLGERPDQRTPDGRIVLYEQQLRHKRDGIGFRRSWARIRVMWAQLARIA